MSLLLLLPLWVVSCGTGSAPPNVNSLAEYPMPDGFKARTVNQPAYRADRNWIDDFGDSEMSDYVKAALKCNHDIKAAEARVQLAAGNARVVGADLYPEFGLTLNGGRSKQNFVGFPIPGAGGDSNILSSTATRFSLLLDVNWEIDLWGLVKAAHSEAIAQLQASQYDKAALELSIAAQAIRTWLVLAESVEQVKLAEEVLGTFKKTEDSVRDRFQRGVEQGVGGSYGSQLLLAQADFHTAKDALAARKEIVSRSSRQLEVLAGKYPCGEAGLRARLPRFPSKRPIEMPCTVLMRRPDLIAAERRLAASDQRIVQAQRAVYPSLLITGDVGTVTERFLDLLDGNFSVWSLLGEFSRPVFSGGKVRAARQQIYQEADLARFQYEKAILTAFAEVENALSSEKFLAERVQALEEAAKLARESYQRSGEEYANGTGDILTMLTTQQRMFSQRSQLIAMKRQQLEARVNLHVALAGSFECVDCINPDPLPGR